MTRAKALGAIPIEQVGSRKHHCSVLSALNKVLTMDLLHLRKVAMIGLSIGLRPCVCDALD
jgi:hypothetical protein